MKPIFTMFAVSCALTVSLWFLYFFYFPQEPVVDTTEKIVYIHINNTIEKIIYVPEEKIVEKEKTVEKIVYVYANNTVYVAPTNTTIVEKIVYLPSNSSSPINNNNNTSNKHKIHNNEMHERFARVYEEYKVMQTRALQLEKDGHKQKWVQVKTTSDAGLGNRFPAIITAMMIAIILNRPMVVQWESKETKLTDLIDPGFEIIQPAWLDLSGTSRSVKSNNFHKDDYQPLMEGNLEEYYKDTDVAYLISGDYPLILLYGNPNYKDWIMENFGLNPFSIIGAKLLKPSPQVQKIVDEFKTTKFAKHNIGLQIRTEKIGYYNKDQNKVVPLYYTIGKMLQGQYFPGEEDNTNYFIASDSEEIINATKLVLGVSRVTSVSPFRARYSSDSELYAWVDILLLSSCDSLVISFRSSFGWVAGALEATDTYMLFADNTYGQLAMSEPCYWNMHGVFKKLSADNINHFNPVFLAQKKCHDDS